MSLHPQLRAIVGPEAVGAVLGGEVRSVDARTGLAAVQVGENLLNLGSHGSRVGDTVCVQLLARDLILATQRPEGLSVRNALTGTIARMQEDDSQTELVYVDIGGAQVMARVTRAASDALGLRAGLGVWVLVKAVSMRAHPFGLRRWRVGERGESVTVVGRGSAAREDRAPMVLDSTS